MGPEQLGFPAEMHRTRAGSIRPERASSRCLAAEATFRRRLTPAYWYRAHRHGVIRDDACAHHRYLTPKRRPLAEHQLRKAVAAHPLAYDQPTDRLCSRSQARGQGAPPGQRGVVQRATSGRPGTAGAPRAQAKLTPSVSSGYWSTCSRSAFHLARHPHWSARAHRGDGRLLG